MESSINCINISLLFTMCYHWHYLTWAIKLDEKDVSFPQERVVANLTFILQMSSNG